MIQTKHNYTDCNVNVYVEGCIQGRTADPIHNYNNYVEEHSLTITILIIVLMIIIINCVTDKATDPLMVSIKSIICGNIAPMCHEGQFEFVRQ